MTADNNDNKKKYNLRKNKNRISSYNKNEDLQNEIFEANTYKQFLSEQFPSKYMKNIVKEYAKDNNNQEYKDYTSISENESDDDVINDPDYEETDNEEATEDDEETYYDEEDTYEDEDDEETDDEDTDDEEDVNYKLKMQPFKIILNLNDYDNNNSSMEEDNGNDTFNDTEEIKVCESKKDELTKLKEYAENYINSNNTDKDVIKKMKKKINNKERQLEEMQGKIKKKQTIYNVNKFNKLLKCNGSTNECKYFKDLNIENQNNVILQVEEINKHIQIDKPYLHKLLETEIPIEFKAIAMKKINSFKHIPEGTSEYNKLKTWIDSFMKIPFNKINNLPISINDGIEKSHEFIINSKNILDNCVYGLEDVKLQILQMIGQWITNPNAMGNAIAIKGPMGTGKTTLVKEGISKILNRPFAFIPLGGTTDSSYLDGHSYTYEGSLWGKIVDILIQTQSMNPVFYFDELDKVSATAKGDEIISILTHLTDITQNNQFHDKYFSEINFDLSKCLFIFSYNNEDNVNPILRDRMYKINTKGYKKEEKAIIAKNYLIPKIQKDLNFKKNDIIIDEDMINNIIDKFTDKEKGVRNLKRCFETIYTKINLYRLMKPKHHIYEKSLKLDIEFPYTINEKNIQELIKLNDENNIIPNMYM